MGTECYAVAVGAIGRYQIIRALGRGGMAEVLEAVAVGEDGFERRIAIKRLLSEYANDAAAGRMFLDEARIASCLHHANIVAMLDYGIADGTPFQVQELVEGVEVGKLKEMGQRANVEFSLQLALHLCLEVAHALDYAHTARDKEGRSLGIVHRDVNPSNILVSWGGDTKLADFGIALAKNRAERTAIGIAKGTILYMAPEQLLQSSIDPRTDIFALGCVLHTLTTGRSPLAGEGTLTKFLSTHELQLDASLPDDVRAIVARATCFCRNERYDTAAAIAKALADALASRLVSDGRSLLRVWLSPLRPEAASSSGVKANGGALDSLLDLEMVLVASGDAVRRFETRRTHSLPTIDDASNAKGTTSKPSGLGQANARESLPATAIATHTQRSRNRDRQRVRNALIAAAAVATVAVVGGTSWLVSKATDQGTLRLPQPAAQPGGSSPAIDSASTRSFVGATTANPPVPAAFGTGSPALPLSGDATARALGLSPGRNVSVELSPPVDAESSIADPNSDLTDHGKPAPASHDNPGHPPPFRRRPSPTVSSPASSGRETATPTAASSGGGQGNMQGSTTKQNDEIVGILLIGGEQALRAEILIDGTSMGYAPKRLTLPLGSHTVELLHSDGRRIGPVTVQLTVRHTLSAPLRYP
ncbi:MAG: serine/threonine-protein kinase [Pseudomonadota bacterium]